MNQRQSVRHVTWLLLILCAWLPLTAGDPDLTVKLGAKKATVGDTIDMRVQLSHDGTWIFDQTLPEEKLGDAVILEGTWQDIPPTADQPAHLLVLQLKLAFYDYGEFVIPELALAGRQGDAGEPRTFYTPEQVVQIESVLANENDQKLADDRSNLEKRVSPVLLILAGLALLLVLALAAWLFYRWRQPKPVVAKPEPLLPPFDEAMQNLQTLTSGSLLKEGRVKDFYVEINHIIRRYYSRLYRIHAEEMTSFELEQWLEDQKHISAEIIGLNRAFQEQCDAVKFAKYDPNESENKENVNRAYQIVEQLKPATQPAAPNQEVDHVAVG